MSHFIICEYHDCEKQHLKELEYNKVVNLSLVETVFKEGRTSIKFVFQKNEPIIWRFINDAIRDLEFERIMDEIKERQFSR